MVDKVLFSSKKTDWQTPRSIFVPLHDEFRFTVDAAASKQNAMLSKYWTEEDNALTKDWTEHNVWCNPPYGRASSSFIKKAAECEADVAVLLLPARTDTIAWHNYIFPRAEIRFLKGRIKFEGADNSAPFPSAIVIFRHKHFQQVRKAF